MKDRIVTVGGETVQPGTRRIVDLPVADLYTHTSLNMPVQIINGRRAGPTLFVTAAIHGDEINGVEIIRRLLRLKTLASIRGTLLAVPIVNVHGFLDQSRYLPDRRDLNRSFPGSEKGSVAARLAHMLVTEVINQSDCGIDLHTGSLHRSNLPQIRANLGDPRTRELAQLFGVPVLLNSGMRDGSLRQYAAEKGVPMLLYEAGEALRFDELAIRAHPWNSQSDARARNASAQTRSTAATRTGCSESEQLGARAGQRNRAEHGATGTDGQKGRYPCHCERSIRRGGDTIAGAPRRHCDRAQQSASRA